MGQRRSLAESRPFRGNSRWCSAWLNSREVSGVDPKRGAVCSREDSRRYDVLSYTSGAAGGSGVIEILCLYQVSSMFCLYQVKSTFYLYQVKSTFCLYQVRSTFCLYQGVVYPYSHQRLWGGERLGGRYTPVERLRRRLRDCHREGCLLGDDTCCGRLVSPISNTVGGWAWRSKAAASGRAASITTRVSGRWAHGSSRYTTPGLSLVASPASRVGLVTDCLEGSPEKGLVQGCSREGEEKPDPEVVHSSKGGSQILSGVWMGRLIKPWNSTAVQAKLEC